MNPPPAVVIEEETAADTAAVEAIVSAAFGPGRYAKTAERLREQSACAFGLVARAGGEVIGTVRLWKITVGETPALFLGPIAVRAEARKLLTGARLVEAALERVSDGAGVLLVGDLAYFQRFGFVPAPGVTLGGPVDQRRVLWKAHRVETPTGAVLPSA